MNLEPDTFVKKGTKDYDLIMKYKKDSKIIRYRNVDEKII